jgi:hypothetical protein
MIATIHKLPTPSIERLACTHCGAETNAACNCGAPYVPVAQRVKEYDAANPGKSTRAAAADLGISKSAVSKARDQVSTSGQVTGQDGKRYPAKKPRPDVEALQARAGRVGWTLDSERGKYRLYRPDDNNPDLCHGDPWFYEIRLRLCDVDAQLTAIENSPDPANYKQPDEGDEPAAEATPAQPAPSVTIDKVKIAETRSQCIAAVRAAVDDAVQSMRCCGANNVDFGLLVDALKGIVRDIEDEAVS